VFGNLQFIRGVIFALSKISTVPPLSLPGPAEGTPHTHFLLPDLRALEIGLDSMLSPGVSTYELIGEELRALLTRRGESDGMWMDEGRWKDQPTCSPSAGSPKGIGGERTDQPDCGGNEFYTRRAVNALESLCIEGPIDEEHKEWLMERVGTLFVVPLGSEEWMPF